MAKYLDLTPLIPWRQISRPVDWAAHFGRTGPLVLEIGTGNGEYCVRQSLAHPEWNLVGLDVHWGSVRRALRRVAQSEQRNIRLMQIDANIAVEWMFPEASLEHVYALFPCPWPKRQHAHMRLFSPDFLSCLAPKLKPGGSLMVVTDHALLRDFILGNVAGTGFEAELKVIPARYDTKYERRWEGQGQSEFYEVHLTTVPGTVPPAPQREVQVYTHYSPGFDPETFRPEPLRGELVIDFKRILFDPKAHTAMVLATVIEHNLAQNFWISVHQVGPARWSVAPAPGGGVLPTAGIQRSLDLIFEAASRSVGVEPVYSHPQGGDLASDDDQN